MKTLKYFILLILFILSYSCSKEEDNPEIWPKHKFKITLELSGDYKNYELFSIIGVTSETKELSRNIQTGEENYLLQTDLVNNFYEFESVKKSMHLQLTITSSSIESYKEANIKVKIYLDDELFNEENIIVTEHTSRGWLYYKGKFTKRTEFNS